jgi:hypothetical protein
LKRESIHICPPFIDTAGYVKVWHYPTQQCVFTFDEKDRQPLTLDFNCTYTRLFVAGTKKSYKFIHFIPFQVVTVQQIVMILQQKN